MKITRSSIVILAALLVLSLAACVRSVPGAQPPAAPTTAGQPETLPSPGATDVLDQIYLFATQTAIAAGGGAQPPAQGTPGAPAQPAASEPAPAQPQPTQVPPIQPAPASPVPAQPAAPVPAWAPTPGIPASYTLQRGEFPFCIARRFNVNPSELLRINGLSSYSVFFAGMALRMPQSGAPFPGNRALFPHPTTYTARPGDTFHTIACIFGDVDPEGIAFVNGMQVNQRPSPGQVLNIP